MRDRIPIPQAPRNERGTRVDPVPFLVVSLVAVTTGFSYGPLYLLAFGLALPAALGVSGVLVGAAIAVAYYRYVWTARPELRGDVPVDARLKRLVYGVFALIGAMVLLALPLLALGP